MHPATSKDDTVTDARIAELASKLYGSARESLSIVYAYNSKEAAKAMDAASKKHFEDAALLAERLLMAMAN